jgi:hypothetical protein
MQPCAQDGQLRIAICRTFTDGTAASHADRGATGILCNRPSGRHAAPAVAAILGASVNYAGRVDGGSRSSGLPLWLTLHLSRIPPAAAALIK